MLKTAGFGLALTLIASTIAAASPMVYRPINPTFGGDALNGNWLLATGQAQIKGGGSSSPGFTIDFPDFGGVAQPGITNPVTQPTTETDTSATDN